MEGSFVGSPPMPSNSAIESPSELWVFIHKDFLPEIPPANAPRRPYF